VGQQERAKGTQLGNYVGGEMSNLREAAQDALAALNGVLDTYGEPLDKLSIAGGTFEALVCRDAITALRAALAQPEQEPVAVVAMDVSGVHMSYGGQYLGQKPDTKIAMLLKDLPVGTHLYVAVGMGVSND
jgi:hypothetical protein